MNGYRELNFSAIETYIQELSPLTLRYILNTPDDKWTSDEFKSTDGRRCFIGHVRKSQCICVKPQDIFIGKAFDEVCFQDGLEITVRRIKSVCEEALKIRGEATVDLSEGNNDY